MNKKMDIYEKLVLIVGLILALGLVAITALGVVKKVKNKDNAASNRKVTINQRMKGKRKRENLQNDRFTYTHKLFRWNLELKKIIRGSSTYFFYYIYIIYGNR